MVLQLGQLRNSDSPTINNNTKKDWLIANPFLFILLLRTIYKFTLKYTIGDSEESRSNIRKAVKDDSAKRIKGLMKGTYKSENFTDKNGKKWVSRKAARNQNILDNLNKKGEKESNREKVVSEGMSYPNDFNPSNPYNILLDIVGQQASKEYSRDYEIIGKSGVLYRIMPSYDSVTIMWSNAETRNWDDGEEFTFSRNKPFVGCIIEYVQSSARR